MLFREGEALPATTEIKSGTALVDSNNGSAFAHLHMECAIQVNINLTAFYENILCHPLFEGIQVNVNKFLSHNGFCTTIGQDIQEVFIAQKSVLHRLIAHKPNALHALFSPA